MGRLGHNSLRPVLQFVLRGGRAALRAVVHLVLFAGVYAAALTLVGAADPLRLWLRSVLWVGGVKLIAFYLFGHYRIWWRYVTFEDLRSLAGAATAATALIAVTDYAYVPDYRLSMSLLVVDWMLTVCAIGGLRAGSRAVSELCEQLRAGEVRRRVLLVARGLDAAHLTGIVRALARRHWRVVGIVQPGGAESGVSLGGVEVVDAARPIAVTARELRVRDVVVLENNVPGDELRALFDSCREENIRVHVLPSLDDWLGAARPAETPAQRALQRRVVPPRSVDIADLLRRDPVQLDVGQIGRLISGTTVLVTGAGGSIGSELARQVIAFRPARLLLVERFENNLFEAHRSLVPLAGDSELVPLIADVTDRPRMEAIFRRWRIDTVFHAAAHKHVPMMEWNPGEAIKNNVLGTECAADLANRFGVGRFVLISTDKAVNPTSVMGVTKQLAERIVYGKSLVSATRFVTVRFGNVLGSAGSVVPIFQEQIRRGGPVTVTHPEMRRYFMTIPEASQLVLQAAALGEGGEIFVLDMGQPVRIVDLARDLIRLSGFEPHEIEIVYTGIRPGEKLFEELYFDEEQLLKSSHEKIRIAKHRPYSAEEVAEMITSLSSLVHETDAAIREALRALVLDYVESHAVNRSAPSLVGEGSSAPSAEVRSADSASGWADRGALPAATADVPQSQHTTPGD